MPGNPIIPRTHVAKVSLSFPGVANNGEHALAPVGPTNAAAIRELPGNVELPC